MIEEDVEATEDGAPIWMTSFSDMMILMLCFFVLLLSFAKPDAQTFDSALGSVRKALGEKAPPPSAQVSPAPVTAVSTIAPPEGPASTATEQRRDADVVREFLAERGLLADIDVMDAPRGLVLRARDRILFDSAAAELRLDGRPVLDAVRELVGHFRGQLAVEGHTDDRAMGSALFPSNWELSGARSAAVLRYLIDSGVPPERVHVAGYAHTRPVTSNADETGRAQNRRVEFVFEHATPDVGNRATPAASGSFQLPR